VFRLQCTTGKTRLSTCWCGCNTRLGGKGCRRTLVGRQGKSSSVRIRSIGYGSCCTSSGTYLGRHGPLTSGHWTTSILRRRCDGCSCWCCWSWSRLDILLLFSLEHRLFIGKLPIVSFDRVSQCIIGGCDPGKVRMGPFFIHLGQVSIGMMFQCQFPVDLFQFVFFHIVRDAENCVRIVILLHCGR